MSATTASIATNDIAFYRKRQLYMRLPLIVWPFILVLYPILGGGDGTRLQDDMAVTEATQTGFNSTMPVAENGSIKGREVEKAGYGQAAPGQVLSAFSHTVSDSVKGGLKTMPVDNPSSVATTHASSLAASTPVVAAQPVRHARTTAYAAPRRQAANTYYYTPPGGTVSDQQLTNQLRDYQANKVAPAKNTPALTSAPAPAAVASADAAPASVQITDNVTASRLSEETDNSSPFYTAPTEGSRRKSERAVLSSGNSYGSKKTIAWMIPVVVHEDQTIKDGQQVKLRLLKEITADGVTIPANTILYAVCKLSDDRLRLTVNNLQLHGQLIPLNLDVYDTDGSQGVNVPGLSQSSQNNGQLRSSAIQGLNVPGIGGLATSVLSSARMSAANSARQTSIRLRAGYNLFLKA
jgi:conjugative transposon TraM protein